MKVKTDICGDLEIPKQVQKAYREWCKRHDVSEPSYEVDSSFDDFYYDGLGDFNGKLLPKEEAEFLAAYTTCNTAKEGGYPVEARITFTDRGIKYTTIAFAWTSKLDDKGELSIVAYKEPAQRKGRKGKKT
jgi:hypothetical protein